MLHITLSLLSGWAIFSLSLASFNPSHNLDALNRTLHGRVRAIEPFALPCFSTFEGKPVHRNDALCAERQANYADPLYRRNFPSAYMYDTSSINASDTTSEGQCLLDISNPRNPVAWEGRDCKLGNLASYYLDVRGACDAIKVFQYAQKSGLRISIKNSGHTYVEDASLSGSLLLWTRNLNKLRYADKFVLEGCSSEKKFNTITTGAGISCGEAYEFADKHGVTILCGYSQTVGISGGWVMGGGHSVLSNVYGLGADRVVQFKLVTPEGELRIANKCQNTDLFWALRGGGGGTYGLIIESTHMVESRIEMSVASISLPSNASKAVGDFMDILVDTAVSLAEDGWGGHIYGTRIVYVNPLLKNAADARRSMKKVTNFVISHGGTSNITVSSSWYKFFQDYVLSSTYSVGNLQLIGTQLAPIELFVDDNHKKTLKAFFRSEIGKGNLPYIPVGSPYLSRKHLQSNDTSANPVWYRSLWEIGIGGSFAWNSTFDQRLKVVRDLQKGTKSLQALTLGGAAYKNEANPFTTNWRQAWFGDNYARLLAIKHKYDPHRDLRCWGCVGWTEQDAELSSYRAFTHIADQQSL